jgi:predicted acylesterase/phospholipase RssA
MRDLGVTFAGGGNRCFYQIGLLEHWGHKLWPRVAAVSGCSAGAGVLMLLLSGRAETSRAHWDSLRRGVRKNLDPLRALRGEPMAPHEAIYRSTILHAMADGGLERMRSQPFPIYLLCSRPPAWLNMGLATWLGLGAYALEKRLDPYIMHSTAGRRLGFREFVFDARNCETAEEVADLVIASSATPPFTPVGAFRTTRALDGGLIDNAPAFVVEREARVRRNLVLLTRAYPSHVLGPRGSRLYVGPSEPPPVHRWDYTEGATERVDRTVDLGRRDALAKLATLEAWLAERSAETELPTAEAAQ